MSRVSAKYPAPARGVRALDTAALFAAEGALLQFVIAANGFANNLYASTLGATDTQIGLIQMVPNVAAVLLLIPVGMLADRLRSTKTIPLTAALCQALGFLLMASAPQMGAYRMAAFFAALVFTVGGPVLYNAQWQNFFGDVVRPEARNSVLTVRSGFMYAMGISAPFLGAAMMRGRTGAYQIQPVFRTIFLICAAVMLVQAGVLAGIRTPPRTDKAGESENMAGALKRLLASRTFRLFYIPIVVFYLTWQCDWSVWYIGQVQYLHLTEAQITAFSGVCNIGQLAAVLILSRRVRRVGPDRTLPFAALGLAVCPAMMLTCMFVPMSIRFLVFTLVVGVLSGPQCAVALCAVQILLRTAPQGCRNLAVSLYTLTITLSNCIMPLLGVRIYTALGANQHAMVVFNATVFLLRVVMFGVLMLRGRMADRFAD